MSLPPARAIDVSIVVPVWNTRSLVLACLADVERAREHARGRGLEAEVLVVDNGSRDGTAAAVRARFPDVRLLRLQRNRGFAAGCNAGLRAMRGRHAFLLNSDALLEPGALEACVGHLDAQPHVGVVGPALRRPDGTLEGSIHRAPALWSELLPRSLPPLLWPRRFPSKRSAGREPLAVHALRGAALCVRGAVIREVGPLPEEYFFFLEETDWCERIRAAGHQVVYLPAARVTHRSGASSKRPHPARTRIEYHRSLYRFFRSRRGALASRVVLAVRFAKSLLGVVVQAPFALLSRRARARCTVHGRVLAWHLRGCPASEGLMALSGDGDPR